MLNEVLGASEPGTMLKNMVIVEGEKAEVHLSKFAVLATPFVQKRSDTSQI